MSYKVTCPLVIVPNADGVNGDGYFYKDAVIPAGFNDERCKVLVKDGMLEGHTPEQAAESLDPNKAPAKSAAKGDWVVFASAVERGDDRLSEEDANALTKEQLVELFAA